ncbi:MAG: ribulose-phosphate 3-epimerase [Oscillospiraceae bacterium]|nr:ribulose-phosphate 3-epimerase [Oscillospiraceae bacterium]MCR5173378.1 ribulose-phosphate 3-epimerase [Oscillospiraceae bacterium]
MTKIAPSILSADFACLGQEIRSIETADYLHFDVMDGLFVPNISIGIPVLESVRKITDMTLDVHLMIDRPHRYVERFADAGADLVVFHLEADAQEDIRPALRAVRARGKRAGLAVKPATPAEDLIPYLSELDLALVMTVEPGFGGQRFMEDMLPKVELLRKTVDREGLPCEIEVDGGVNPATAALCRAAGADVLVAGSDVFRAADRAARIAQLRGETA